MRKRKSARHNVMLVSIIGNYMLTSINMMHGGGRWQPLSGKSVLGGVKAKKNSPTYKTALLAN